MPCANEGTLALVLLATSSLTEDFGLCVTRDGETRDFCEGKLTSNVFA